MNAPAHKSLTSSQRAARDLRTLIFQGELPAGSNHLESELAERLGMSRTPVREAALLLEAQGLLELRPRKGVRILEISPTDMREIYDVLTELESLAAFNAAHQRYGTTDLAALTRATDQMEAALQADDLDAWAAADDQFHSELVRLGANSRVISIVAMMADQVRRARAITLHIRDRPHQSTADHRAVLNAIRDHAPDRARSLHHAHRDRSKTEMLALLDKHHLRKI